MADIDYNGRLMALGALLVATGFPTSTWPEVWEHISQEDTPTSLEDVGALVDRILELKPLILGDDVEVFVLGTEGRTFEDPAFVDDTPITEISSPPNATRGKKVTDGGS